jgi:hypothetical protein
LFVLFRCTCETDTNTGTSMFWCKYTDMCLDPNCWGNSFECPRDYEEPKEGNECTWSSGTECHYGKSGPCFNKVLLIFNSQPNTSLHNNLGEYCCSDSDGPCFPRRSYTCDMGNGSQGTGSVVLEDPGPPTCLQGEPDPSFDCPLEQPEDGSVCRSSNFLTCHYGKWLATIFRKSGLFSIGIHSALIANRWNMLQWRSLCSPNNMWMRAQSWIKDRKGFLLDETCALSSELINTEASSRSSNKCGAPCLRNVDRIL